jgi:hypothetical protein
MPSLAHLRSSTFLKSYFALTCCAASLLLTKPIFADSYNQNKGQLMRLANKHRAWNVIKNWPNQGKFENGNPELRSKLYENGGWTFRALGPGHAAAFLREVASLPNAVVLAVANHNGGGHGLIGGNREGSVVMYDGIDPGIDRRFRDGAKIRQAPLERVDQHINKFYHIWLTTPEISRAVADYAHNKWETKRWEGMNCSGLCSKALEAGGRVGGPEHPFSRVTYHGWGWDVVHLLNAAEAGPPHMILWVPNSEYASRVFNGEQAVLNYGHEP